jgi:hypothetical protein
MPKPIPRFGTVLIANGQNDSAALNMELMSVAGYKVPTGWTGGATVSFKGAEKATGTFVPIYDQFDVLVSRTISADRGYNFPNEVYSWPYVKIVAVSAVTREETILWTRKG